MDGLLEQLLDEMCIPAQARAAMRDLDDEKKLQLLELHGRRAAAAPPPTASTLAEPRVASARCSVFAPARVAASQSFDLMCSLYAAFSVQQRVRARRRAAARGLAEGGSSDAVPIALGEQVTISLCLPPEQFLAERILFIFLLASRAHADGRRPDGLCQFRRCRKDASHPMRSPSRAPRSCQKKK